MSNLIDNSKHQQLNHARTFRFEAMKEQCRMADLGAAEQKIIVYFIAAEYL